MTGDFRGSCREIAYKIAVLGFAFIVVCVLFISIVTVFSQLLFNVQEGVDVSYVDMNGVEYAVVNSDGRLYYLLRDNLEETEWKCVEHICVEAVKK